MRLIISFLLNNRYCIFFPNYLVIGCCDSLAILCSTMDLGLTSFEIFGFPPSEELDSYNKTDTSYFTPVTSPLFYFAYTGGLFASLFLTLERYLGICRQISISLKKTKIISFGLILFSAILTSPSWFFYTWGTFEYKSVNYTVAVKSEYVTRNLEIFSMASDILLFVIPLTLFLVFNILIIKKVRKI